MHGRIWLSRVPVSLRSGFAGLLLGLLVPIAALAQAEPAETQVTRQCLFRGSGRGLYHSPSRFQMAMSK